MKSKKFSKIKTQLITRKKNLNVFEGTIFCHLVNLASLGNRKIFSVSDTDVLVFEDHKTIFIETSTRYISYKFNFSNFNFIDYNRQKIVTLSRKLDFRFAIKLLSKLVLIFGMTNNYIVLYEKITDFRTTSSKKKNIKIG